MRADFEQREDVNDLKLLLWNMQTLNRDSVTCPAQVALDHVKPFLNPPLHVVQVVQHGAQGAVHALQLVHQVTVVLRRLVLVLQELQHAVVWLAKDKKRAKVWSGCSVNATDLWLRSHTKFLVDVLSLMSDVSEVFDYLVVTVLHLQALHLQMLTYILCKGHATLLESKHNDSCADFWGVV